MNFLSACCMREIITTNTREYPLGGSTFFQTFKIDVCSGCGLEIDEPVAVTECCGEISCECGDSCRECGAELSESNEYHMTWGTCNSSCYEKMVS